MPYRCEAVSVEGFVQQLACNLINKGYWHFVSGTIPSKKDPTSIDAKLIELYGLDVSKWTRSRRKAKGLANVAYLRHGRFFVLLATMGEHLLFERESYVRDIRRQPIRFHGYSIGCGKGSDGRYHSSVRISDEAFATIRARMLELAVRRTPDALLAELESIPFVPYARVRRQLLRVLREVNEARRTAGFEQVTHTHLNLRRRVYRVFAEAIAPSESAPMREDTLIPVSPS
jgi:hypothetical protein